MGKFQEYCLFVCFIDSRQQHQQTTVGRSFPAVVSPLWPRGRAAEMVPRAALALGESRAVRSARGGRGRPREAGGTGGMWGAEDENI